MSQLVCRLVEFLGYREDNVGVHRSVVHLRQCQRTPPPLRELLLIAVLAIKDVLHDFSECHSLRIDGAVSVLGEDLAIIVLDVKVLGN